MHLDLVPRLDGVAVDVDHTSVVELYKIVSVLYCFHRARPNVILIVYQVCKVLYSFIPLGESRLAA